MKARIVAIAIRLLVGFISSRVQERRAEKKSAAREADLLKRFTK